MSDQPAEIYRLRTARGNHSAGGGECKLFESRKRFEETLYEALIEEATNSKEDELKRRRSRSWLVHILRKGNDVGISEWTTTKVIAAEKLIDGQWIDLGARLIAPSIEFANEKEELE